MQRVFSSLKLAKERLQAYADNEHCECCIYRTAYGREKLDEYTIRRIDQVVDKSSKNIVAMGNPSIHVCAVLTPAEPPIQVPPAKTESYLYELMLMQEAEGAVQPAVESGSGRTKRVKKV